MGAANNAITPQAQGKLLEALQILSRVRQRTKQNVRDTAIVMRLLREAAQVPEYLPVWLSAELMLNEEDTEELLQHDTCGTAQDYSHKLRATSENITLQK